MATSKSEASDDAANTAAAPAAAAATSTSTALQLTLLLLVLPPSLSDFQSWTVADRAAVTQRGEQPKRGFTHTKTVTGQSIFCVPYNSHVCACMDVSVQPTSLLWVCSLYSLKPSVCSKTLKQCQQSCQTVVGMPK